MRILALFAAAALVSGGIAQSPLATLTGGTNLGNVGGGIYFDLQVNTTVTFTQIDFLCGNTTVAGSGVMDIYLGPSTYLNNVTNAGLWTIVASTNSVPVAPSVVSNGVIATPFALGPGNYGVALKANNFSNGYTNGGVCSSPTIPGSCTSPPSIFTNAQLTLRAGAAQNSFLTGGVFSPRVFNGALHYTLGGTPVAVASTENYGRGCYSWFHSFYDFMPSTATGMNLGTNGATTNSIGMSFIGTGYAVGALNTAGTWFTPTSAVSVIGANGTITQAIPFSLPYPTPSGPLGTSSLVIGENGVAGPLAVATTVPPAVGTFLSGPAMWGNWHDLDQTNAGSGVHYDVDPSGNRVYVTWLNMADSAIAATSNNFQLAFSNTGAVELRWQVMSLSGGGAWPTVIGWTPGGGVQDPGNIDLAASPAFTTGPTDNPPLTLNVNARPRLGTSPGLVTTNIPVGTPFGGVVVGFTQINPGVPPIAGGPTLPGLTGCLQYVHLSNSVTNLYFTSPSATLAFPIPNNVAYNGIQIYAQSVAFASGYNPFGALTSNGARMVVGSL